MGINHEKNPKTFICYSQTTDDENLEDYILTRKRKVLIAFDYMTADMDAHKKVNPIVTELFKKDSKLDSKFVFITHSYFKVPKHITLNTAHCFIMKISNKIEIYQIALNHLSHFRFKG